MDRHHIKVSVYPKMKATTVPWRRFTVERLPKTPAKYIFSESLRLVDYEGVFYMTNKETWTVYQLHYDKRWRAFLKNTREM